MNRLSGKTALVTGAARGIGLAIARLFAREGARVTLADIDEDVGRTVTQTLLDEQMDVRFARLDVRSESEWASVAAGAHETYGPLDILVNDAGIYLIAPIEQTSLDDLHRVLRVNVDGVFLGMRTVVPRMAGRGSGSIINISSMDGIIGAPGLSAYGASKAAVRLLTKNVAMEVAARGVRVNSIHPGYIRTRMAEYGAKCEGKSSVDELGDDFPMGRIGEPLDVAYGALYLASDESRWVTGSELVIDGGATAGDV